jgi:hypothetical protein
MNESPNIVLGLELSHRELLALGNIVAQWGLNWTPLVGPPRLGFKM